MAIYNDRPSSAMSTGSSGSEVWDGRATPPHVLPSQVAPKVKRLRAGGVSADMTGLFAPIGDRSGEEPPPLGDRNIRAMSETSSSRSTHGQGLTKNP